MKTLELLGLVTRTGMYIHPPDKYNLTSFITGYETGSMDMSFTRSLEEFVARNYRIDVRATGWPGQIERLSKKLKLSWEVAFKKVALEVLAAGVSTEDGKEWKKRYVTTIDVLLHDIDKDGRPWFSESWVQNWISICPVESDWFRRLWSPEKFEVIAIINNLVISGKAFAEKKQRSAQLIYLPSDELVELKLKYDRLS